MSEAKTDPNSAQQTTVTEWNDGNVRRVDDLLVSEDPLLIQVGEQSISVTMRTPGDDFDLAAGFLFTEGIIKSREEILGLRHLSGTDPENSTVQVDLRDSAAARAKAPQRNFVANSGCGLCGKASLADIYTPGIGRPNPAFRMTSETLCRLPDALRSAQALFTKTGGLHAAALFDSAGNLVVLKEDVGRHNAVDKVVGWALMHDRLPLSDCALLASGRGGFEIIQKSLMAGIPLLASVSAASSLAVQMARELGMTLVGFLRGRRYIVYCGEERLGLSSST